jgi:citrate lyase subunit beta/citryl-CoA lyase
VLDELPAATPRLVRVNAAGTPELPADLAALEGARLDGLVLPKATPAALDMLPAHGPPLVAIVETATGLRETRALAAHPRVAVLALGSVDLSAELGLIPRADGLELLLARSTLVLESAAAGLRAPIDGVHVDVRDLDGLAARARLARTLGMRGTLCIHPAQIAVVHAAFAPDERELDWARRVLDAASERPGVAALDGEMVDAAVVARARRLLAERPQR